MQHDLCLHNLPTMICSSAHLLPPKAEFRACVCTVNCTMLTAVGSSFWGSLKATVVTSKVLDYFLTQQGSACG